MLCVETYWRMAASRCRDFRVVVLEAGGAAHDFGEVERFDGDAVGFENFFAVADGVEGGGTRADGADAKPLEAFDDAADGEEPVQIFLETCGVGRFGVQCRERIRDSVLREVVAGRHFSAKAVAAIGDQHARWRIRRGLHQDGNAEVGHAERVRDGAFIAEVR